MASPKTVRFIFEQKLKSGIPHPPGKFHPMDLKRVNDDKYIMRILAHVDNDIQEAVNMLWDILLWRATVGASDINENNIRMDYLKEGFIYPYGRDVDGCLMLVFNAKIYYKNKKDFEEVKKILIYWLDRMEKEENGNKISVFCDMSEYKLSDFDKTLCSYIITLFKNYYPHFFNFLIVFQMPWSLSPIFKTIKSLLPPRAASKMKFVTKYTISKRVQLDHALKDWGGKDTYQYEFLPENKCHITKFVPSKQDTNPNSGMIDLKPNNTIIFRGSDNKLTFCMMLTVTNTNKSAIFFELRPSNPEIFCVNPNFGVLDVTKSKSVVIVVQDYFHLLTLDALTTEKLMVVAIQVPNVGVTREELYEIWQNSPNYVVQDYTFKRLLNDIKESSTIIANSLADLRVNNESLQNQLHYMKLYQILTLIVVTFAAFIFCFHSWS